MLDFNVEVSRDHEHREVTRGAGKSPHQRTDTPSSGFTHCFEGTNLTLPTWQRRAQYSPPEFIISSESGVLYARLRMTWIPKPPGSPQPLDIG